MLGFNYSLTRRFLLRAASILALIFVWATFAPSSASAAVCADYDNQAEAQRAADTRDADGDGIYCEALPCPCLKGGGGGGGSGGGSGGTKKKKKKKKKAKPIYTYSGRVTEVVDGDTIKVKLKSGGTTTVQLIGVDAPELGPPSECGATDAKSAAIEWSFYSPLDFDGDGLFDSGADGYSVTLVTDNTMSRYDSSGRLLAYVYDESDQSLQRTLLQAGWVDTYYPGGNGFRKAGPYERDWSKAESSDRGVFGKCDGNFHSALK